MITKKFFRIVSVTGFLLCWNSFSLAKSIEDSVVKVIAGEQSGTGFVWEGKLGKYIATSLHTLAGASKIYYNKALARYELEVYKTDKESDLALLRAKSGNIELPALKLGSVEPVQDRRYWIYGYPAGVKKVQGDSVEFSKAQHNIPMKEYLDSKIVKKITASGYPLPTLKLLRVSSGITPGHSGAPIIDPDDNNSVIGIGAGGLSNIGFQRVNWAVPALTYLPSLEEQGILENTANMSVSQDNRKFSVRHGQAESPLESARIKYYHVGQVPLNQLLESLVAEGVDPKDQWFDHDSLLHIKNTAKKEKFDIKAPIDIYQNTQTGIMVYIPARIPRKSITVKDDNTLIVDGGRARMHLQIKQGRSLQHALQNKDWFLGELDSVYGTNNWPVDKDSRWHYDEPAHYPEIGYWEHTIVKYKPGPEYWLSEAEFSFRINYSKKQQYGHFLGVAMMGLDYDNWVDGPDDEMYFLLDTCAWVSGFVPK